MVPKPNDRGIYQYSSVGIKANPGRDAFLKTSDQWLEDKKAVDGAEGLWRIHDDLYDLSDFIHKHPGGRFWLEITKGSDVTEAFETHHVSAEPARMLQQFQVRKAKTPRNSPFTFAEDGFYRTLKRNVREAMKTVPKNVRWKSHLVSDLFLLSSFVCAVWACRSWSYSLGVLSGVLFASTAVAAHNYCHQRDSFRMYYGDLAFVPLREVRIIHVLSHHMYTNTVSDMQAYSLEPLLNVFPNAKPFLVRYGSWIYGPLLIFPMVFHMLFLSRIMNWIVHGQSKHLGKSDLLPAILPWVMYCFAGQPLLPTLLMWTLIIGVNSFWSSFIGGAGTHFHPDLFMDGDKPRSPEELDWGIIQLDTVSDRKEFYKVHWLGLITFGDHAMHHLFPSVDQAFYNYLYPILEKTMDEFNLSLRVTNHADMFSGFLRQLARVKPNSNPPLGFVNNNTKQY